jgi:hypothetical protein
MLTKTKRKFMAKVIGSSLFFFVLASLLSGCTWLQELLNPNRAPIAVIQSSATSGVAPLEVLFDGSNSYDPDHDPITEYSWTVSDGRTFNGVSVYVGFNTAGEFTIQLRITDVKGKVGIATTKIIVLQPEEEALEHTFSAREGTELDTGTGLKVVVPPMPSEEQLKLVVRRNPKPSQLPQPAVKLQTAYTIDVLSANPLQAKMLSPSDDSRARYRLEFAIPPGADPRNVFVLYWDGETWTLADNLRGTPGGTLSSDGRIVWVEVDHLSTYAIALMTWEGEWNAAVVPETSDPQLNNEGHLVTEVLLSSPQGVLGLAKGAWYELTIVPSIQYIKTEAPEDALFGYFKKDSGFIGPGENKKLIFTFYGTGGCALLQISLEGGFKMAVVDYLYRAATGESLPWPISKGLLEDAALQRVLSTVFSDEFASVLVTVKDEGPRGLLQWLASQLGGLWWRLAGTIDLAIATVIYNTVAAGTTAKIAAEPLSVRVTVEPPETTIEPGGTVQFQAKVHTKDGKPLSTSLVKWEATGGSIDKDGVFHAPGDATGTFEVRASVPAFQAGNVRWVEGKALVRIGGSPPFDFSLTIDPSTGAVSYGNSIRTTVRAWCTAGSTTRVDFTVTDVPPGITADPSSWSWDLGDRNGFVTFSASSKAAVGTYNIKIRATGGGATKEATFTLTVTALASQVAAQIVSYNATPRQVQVGQEVTLGMTVRNTGNTSWTFYGAVSLRKPSGTQIDLDLKPINLDAGQKGTVSWTYTPDTAGNWDVVFGVWKEASQQNSLGHTGWLTGYITVNQPANQLPDLVVDDIWLDPNPPGPGGSTTIAIRVKNQGNANVDGSFLLELYIDNAYQGRVTINGLAAEATRTEYWQAMRWPSDTNAHEIKGVVDPDNRIRESNENNNILTKQFRAQQSNTPSFNFDISVTPASKTTPQGSVISTTVRAWRTAGSTTNVTFTVIGFPTGITVDPQNWSWDLGDQSRDIVFSIGSNAPVGTYTITIRGMGGGVIKEATFTLTVTKPSPQLPDLIVEDIWTDPNPPLASSDVVIGVKVRNKGTADITTSFFLEVQLLDSQGRPLYARKETINGLGAGNSYTSVPTTTAKWPSTTDPCILKATVDSDGTIPESDESNNTLTRQVQAVNPPQPVGALLIRSEPGEADVYVDGQYKGKTPAVTTDYLPIVNLPAGEHEVKVTKSGYNDWLGKVNISPGGTTQLVVHLSILTPPVDQLPKIIRPQPNEVMQVQVGKLFTYQIEARDPEGQPLVYVLTQYPDGMIINQSTGLLQWTPSTSWSGRRAEVTFFVSDRPIGQTSGREVYGKFYIDVKEDALPVILKPQQDEVVEAQVGKAFSYQIQAYDPEQQPIAFYLTEGPTGLTIDGTGLIYWVPQSSFGGQRVKVTFFVTDRGPDKALERAVYRTFYIDVKTQLSAPTILSFGVANIQAESVTLRATVNPNGSRTTVYFEWGLTTSYGNRTTEQNVEPTSISVDISASLSNLTPDTLYHWRVVAINQFGSAYSPDLTFRTLTSGSQPPSSFDFNISLNPSSWTARQNDMTSITVHAWRTAGPTTQVTVSITGLPAGITTNPSTWSWNLGDESRAVTFSVFPNAPVGTHTITITAAGGGRTKTATFSITVTGKFKVGDQVGVSGARLRVRETPCGREIGMKDPGSTGVVLDGPVVCVLPADGKQYTWWKIRWADGLIGWSAEDYLELAI